MLYLKLYKSSRRFNIREVEIQLHKVIHCVNYRKKGRICNDIDQHLRTEEGTVIATENPQKFATHSLRTNSKDVEREGLDRSVYFTYIRI